MHDCARSTALIRSLARNRMYRNIQGYWNWIAWTDAVEIIYRATVSRSRHSRFFVQFTDFPLICKFIISCVFARRSTQEVYWLDKKWDWNSKTSANMTWRCRSSSRYTKFWPTTSKQKLKQRKPVEKFTLQINAIQYLSSLKCWITNWFVIARERSFLMVNDFGTKSIALVSPFVRREFELEFNFSTLTKFLENLADCRQQTFLFCARGGHVWICREPESDSALITIYVLGSVQGLAKSYKKLRAKKTRPPCQ